MQPSPSIRATMKSIPFKSLVAFFLGINRPYSDLYVASYVCGLPTTIKLTVDCILVCPNTHTVFVLMFLMCMWDNSVYLHTFSGGCMIACWLHTGLSQYSQFCSDVSDVHVGQFSALAHFQWRLHDGLLTAYWFVPILTVLLMFLMYMWIIQCACTLSVEAAWWLCWCQCTAGQYAIGNVTSSLVSIW